ncbi:hypothetical protein H5410_027095 [Solanum commersonii]|uniref:Uncharacterized protein n=1 Tax=Solanum commersonii TaxID=4109 RepID=A0A9J5YY25_SOLCO|nr:hypothetical protein H5410_027095 [Solanum commersonii]
MPPQQSAVTLGAHPHKRCTKVHNYAARSNGHDLTVVVNSIQLVLLKPLNGSGEAEKKVLFVFFSKNEVGSLSQRKKLYFCKRDHGMEMDKEQ